MLLGAVLLAGCSFLDGAEPRATDTSPSPSVTATDEPTETPQTDKPRPKQKRPDKTPKPSPSDEATPPSDVDLSKPPTSYAEAAAHVNAAQRSGAPRQLRRFESPDGDFYCVFADRFVRPSCEIGDRSIRDDDLCAGGMARFMGRIELTKGGWRPFCNSDTVREPGATTLSAGEVAAWSQHDIRCVLEKIGLTCISAGRQGFFLGSGRYDTF